MAIGGGLAATPAAALELGELTVQSKLGQPLRASIAYALAPDEMLNDACVSINTLRSAGGLSGIGRSSLKIREGAILITGKTITREPMLGARVTIDCPFAPNLSREYMLLVDPANVSTPPATPTVEEPPVTDAVMSAQFTSGTETEQPSVYEPAVIEEPADTEEPAKTVIQEANTTLDTANLLPGDVVLECESSFIEPVETIVIPDTVLDGPETTSASPDVPTAVISTESHSESTSLLTWLAGGGLAIIVGLALFRRRIRDRFGSTPVGPVAGDSARSAKLETETVEAVSEVDHDISDDSPTQENLTLDADLFTGQGLAEGSDMDIVEDFGFAAATNIDIELPFEQQQAESTDETDIIPPLRPEMESILDSEILPEDDDYDMSVIIDATKMPQPEDVTERDLQAVAVTAGDDSLISGGYTISKEVDFDILEQDYDDYTINSPAILTLDMSDDDETAEMPVANDGVTVEDDAEGSTADTKFI
jgi:hypothetical protein